MLPELEQIRCEWLVVGCKRGDEKAMADLVRMFERPLVYYLRRLVGSEADAWDLLQETWLRVFRNIRNIRDGRAFPAYVYRAARNTAMMCLRKRKADIAMLSKMDPPVSEDPSLDFQTEQWEEVHRVLGRLSLAHREVLTLFFLQDLSLEDIANVLGVAVGTVKSRLHYAKLAARERLEKGIHDE